VLLAKMISTFDQKSGGRIRVNLIAGQAEEEILAEGITYAKEDRYALMEEEVSILKALWTAEGPLDFDGRFHKLTGPSIPPKPIQQPYPTFYLGGGSDDAWDPSAKHSDVHLFWGDTPDRIRSNIADIKARGAEDEALEAAERLVRNIPEAAREILKRDTANSMANRRVQELVAEKGLWIAPHL
jgi:alkanesulfonate monooxygenase